MIALPTAAATICAIALLAGGANAAAADMRAGGERVDAARVDAALRGFVERGALVGVSALVYENGHETYFGAFGMADREAGKPMARDTLVQIFSMTKPITGVALMQMYEAGKFKLDDPLAKYLPEFAHPRVYAGLGADGKALYAAPRRAITIRDITRHTAGFYGSADDTPAVAELYRAADPSDKGNTLADEARKLAALPLLFQPGTRWLYGPSVDLQALLVERLSGMRFDRYLEERIFRPLGMRHTRYVLEPQDGSHIAAMYDWHEDGALSRVPDAAALEFNSRDWPLKPGSFGLVSSLDDYMRFARMLQGGGELDGARLLKAETVRLMATDAMPAAVTDTSWLPNKGQVGFGIDFAVRTRPPADGAEGSGEVGEFFWDGAADTLFWVDPKNKITAVLFTQYKPFGKVPLHKAFRDAVYAGTPSALAHSAQRAETQAAALLDPMFGDHAVLQRDKPIAVWGRAPPGERVTIKLADSSVHTMADAAGRWSATLPPMPAGGPFVLVARAASGAEQAVSDVAIGDVFLCSGQSNMELSVLRAADSDNEIRNSTDDAIRMLSVAHASSPIVLDRFEQAVHWERASPQTVPSWSAVCFFYAREVRKSSHVAIGLVHASWGGSNIRPWMSANALHADGAYEVMLDTLALYARDPAAGQQRFAREWEAWWRRGSHDAPGAEPWGQSSSAARGADSALWLAAPAELRNWREWGHPGLKDFAGLVWYRTTIPLSAAQAQAGATLALGPINQVDETWINGRAIGNTFGYGTERRYAVPAGVLRAGDNVIVINVLSTYGGGGLLAGGEPRALLAGNGESIPLERPWAYRTAPESMGYPPRAPWEPIGGLGTLFNAMIAPMGNFGFRAVLWYQGESNTGEADTYRRLLTEMMADWRRRFGPDLAFLVVQLPNFGTPPMAPGESGWSDVREAQRAAVAADTHGGLAVTIDIGDAHNLHPTNKQDVGRRLARAARHVVYGEPIPPGGPVAAGAARRGHDVVVDFKDVDGRLVAYSHPGPVGFELCEARAGTCRFVEARIEGTRVDLPSPEGPPPTRVRYCWGDSPICTLFDSAGLPAGPFELKVQSAR